MLPGPLCGVVLPLAWLALFVLACRWFVPVAGAASSGCPSSRIAFWFAFLLGGERLRRSPAQKVCSGPGKVPAATSAAYCLRRLEHHAVQVGVLLDEARHPAGAQPGHVLPDEHLGVAVDAGADADGGDAELSW